MVRHNNQLPTNLPQLQNLLKRDPASYKEELLQQYNYMLSSIEVFKLQPDGNSKDLDNIVMFIANVSHCYTEELAKFPQIIMDLLKTHHMVLNPEIRMSFCKALMVLRSKNLLAAIDLLPLFFQLLRCQDKNLRKFLETSIVSDIKNMNAKHKNAKLNTTLQNFMFTMLKDNNSKAAKMSLGIMVQLYKKNIWNDTKTVNVLTSACFSKINKVMSAGLRFFMTNDEESGEKSGSDSDSDNEIDPRDVMMANKVNKKTRKRQKTLERVIKLVKKNKKKKENAPAFNFSALHLIHDPQGFAERLFKRLESSNERFEIKMMILNVVCRLIGIHELLLFNFYPYVQRYLQPHQKEVTKIMLYVAHASHQLVPPDLIQPIITVLVNNFVTERNSSDVMAIGLNAIREICARCPLAMNEDTLKDLAQYKNYRDRSVMMASKSLIHLYRVEFPKMLRKKDRGRPTEATVNAKPKQYGELDAIDHVPGAEILSQTENNSIDIPDESADSDSESDWVDISNNDQEDSIVAETSENKKELAVEHSVNRILTDEDFKKIDTIQLQKQVPGQKKGNKRAHEENPNKDNITLKDIENIHKKRKMTKDERIATVKAGQGDRQKYGFKDRRQNSAPHATNKEKKKTKAFSMIKHKVRGKVKRSFKDKQIALRNHLLKQKKLK